MYFALAKTPGGRPTTVTTAAMSEDSPRTSAVPAPSVFLPHAEPSTSRGVGTSPAASPGPEADGHEQHVDGPQCTLEDYDMSSDDEYVRSGSTFSVALGQYVFQRNLIEDTFTPPQDSKAVIEYVNLKFVENNFRSLGLDQMFDKNNIMQAEQEFDSFEIWFSRVREFAVDREFIRDLRLPLFCHLYLNLYVPRNHNRLQALLKKFEYLFTSPRGVVYLQELKTVTNVLDLSPRLAYFRRNKFVYGVSPMFISNLYDFFHPHFMLKVVFQEWFDINYTAYEDPRIIFDDYYANNLVRVNNLDKANAPKQNNNVVVNKPVLCKKTLNSAQNKNNNRKVNNSENDVSDNEEKKYKRQKKSSRSKFTSDDSNMQMSESLSEVSDNEEKNFKRQKKSGKSKSSSDDNMNMSGLSDISNDGEQKQKQQNKRSKSKFTSDDDNHTSEISSDEKNFKKPQKKQKLRGNKKFDNYTDDSNLSGSSPEVSSDDEISSSNNENQKSKNRRKYKHSDNNSNLSGSSSEDFLEDSSSLNSSYDEEIMMHKFVRHDKKSAQHLRYETSRRLKHINITKIDLKNLDEDWFLRTTKQIVLKNCSKLSCSILTSDLKLVAAGSLDSLIYLWERSTQQSVPEKTPDILHTIGNINPSNFTSSIQGNNLMEYLDKSTAFVLRGHGGPIFDLAELPSAKILLSASNDKTYRAWDMVSKRCLEVYNEHEHRTWCIAACPYSLQVATGSCEGASCLWFLNYKRPLRIFMGHLDDILVLKFHPNQVLLATGSSDKTVRVFELTTGECHRLLMGHSDYITGLEFNAQNPNYLASASGCGEIIVWDIPSSELVWKIRIGNMLFSDLAWLTKDILLASLTNGIVLKCDTTLNYVDSFCKVKGFETTFDRLMSLQMFDNTVYTIGIPDKSGGLKPIPKRNKEKSSQMKNEQKSHRESSPLSKLFFPQHIIDNDGNSMKPLRGLSSAVSNPPYNYEYQLNTNDQFKKSNPSSFLNMNLRSAPFNLSADEISKLRPEYLSENIRLVPAVAITNNLQNAYLLPIQPIVRTTSQNSTNIHSTNDQLPSTSKSHKINKTPGTSKSKITTAKQHNFGNSSLTMHTSIQHMQIKTTTVKEQLHIDDQRETNTLVQQYLQTTSTSIHKQQTSNLMQVTRSGISSQLLQNSIVQQEQQQQSVGSNASVAGTNVQQQQSLQQIRSNTNLTKGNVQKQQRLSPQTNNRSSNTNVTQRPSPRQSPNKPSSLD
ncbi:uncharacterized protein LOC132924402 isoform X3 [Rhopalosiphum padi]|uniref:uncharacterized protein LOC132924402 isoform X3 n=1 Tax=Rhopalosiphum padi TaxID=40932 RepID=UPI00298DE718|nr:uncharacterized protein LOC132924402 isoform X3 [Rhopalosiphum padi]